jgi:superfamily I DNA/RNA helicase
LQAERVTPGHGPRPFHKRWQARLSTLDHWCKEYYQERIGRPPFAGRQPDFALIRRAVLEHVRRRGEFLFDAVLADEAQDLEPEAIELLRSIARHVTVCVDNKQQIYDRGSDAAQILSRLGIARAGVQLLDAFRCCPYVTRLAAQFIPGVEERSAYLRQVRVGQQARETPLWYRASAFADERARLASVIRVRQGRGERVAVLLAQNRHVRGFAYGLAEDGIEVETRETLDFASDRPKVLSYHSAKGLTFDSVLLPSLVQASFANLPEARIERLLFVGASRAATWVYLSSVEATELPTLRRLEALEAEGGLTIQRRQVYEDQPVVICQFPDLDFL